MAVKFLKLRFTEEQYEWLREKAFRERTTMTDIIRGLIDEAMRKEGATMKMNWRQLQIFDCEGRDLDCDSPESLEALDQFRRTGSIMGHFFRRIGGRHENPEDVSTWGPHGPEDIDWTGFDEALRAARAAHGDAEAAEDGDEAYVSSLLELTGQESGFVLYGREGILCNWSSIDGLPRIFATGLVGLGEQIPKVRGEHRNDLRDLLEDVTINVYADFEGDEWPESGTVYNLGNDILVIAPDDWN